MIWTKAPLSERWYADTPLGRVVVMRMKRSKSRLPWSAFFDLRGERIARGKDATEVRRAVEEYIERNREHGPKQVTDGE